jgi:hypothetical protein
VVYRITLRSHPRILVIYGVAALIVAAGVGCVFLLGPLFGLIALAAALFIGYQVVKIIRRQMSTRVETLTDEILFVQNFDEKLSFPWEKVRMTGMAQDPGEDGKHPVRRLFVYNEEDDRMIALTDEFENLDGLAAELRERTDFREITLEVGETLKEKLREIIGQA